MFKISDATTEDISSIIHIAEKTWWPTYGNILTDEQIRYMLDAIYNPGSLGRQMADTAQVFLMGKDPRGPQGFAAYGPRPEEPATYKLHKLYVLPDNQQRGYGRMLIDEIAKRMLRANKHILDVNVNRYNSAVRFYEKYGFKVVREEDVPIGPYWMNDYVMRIEF